MPHSLLVAIADDDLNMRQLLRRILESAGHRIVAAASSGNDLIAFLKKPTEKPDIIISDWQMPHGTGLQVAAYSLKHNSHIPFLLITGSPDDFSSLNPKDQELLELINLLPKPFTPQELLDTVQRLTSPSPAPSPR